MILSFEMPGDQDWDKDTWEKLGVGREWEDLSRAFEAAGATGSPRKGLQGRKGPTAAPSPQGPERCLLVSGRGRGGLIGDETGREISRPEPYSGLEVAMAKLILVKNETNPWNSDGIAVFGYFEGRPTKKELRAATPGCGEFVSRPRPVLDDDLDDEPKQVPDAVSKLAGLQRWFLCQAT